MHSDDLWDDGYDRQAPFARQTPGRGRQKQVREDRYSVASGAIGTVRVSRPQLGVADIFVLLMRELWLIIIVFAAIFTVGVLGALSLPTTYTASASLLMQLGQNYVYEPVTGDAAKGTAATIDQVVMSEVEILNSSELKKRVIAKLGYKTILPDDPQDWTPHTDVARAEVEAKALKVMTGGLGIDTAPASNVVRLSFKHENALSASLILNTLIDTYQGYRQEVFSDVTGPLLQKQKASFDERLAEADTAYQAFLSQNGVGDFVAAKATYSKIYDQVTADIYTTQSQIAEDRAKLNEIKRNLAALSPEMSIERDLDLTVPNRIFALKQQRQELLSHYLPGAQPVKDIDAQIASLQSLMDSGGGLSEQAHKLGTNPIYQDLTTQKLNLEADIASLAGKQQLLQSQADQVTRKMQGLMGIEAQYNNLSAERDSLQTNIRTYTQRIQDNDASRAIAKGDDDSVRVVERASLPDKPKSFKKIVLIVSFLFAAFTALCAGLLRVYTRKGFLNAEMASRTLDLPVLAQAPVK